MLRSAADGEWMPLILCYHWDIDVDVISRFEMEELRTFDHQVSHLNTDSEMAQRTTKTLIHHRHTSSLNYDANHRTAVELET